MRTFPALQLTWPAEPSEDETGLALAFADEFAPSAVEQTPDGLRIFFSTSAQRDAAASALSTDLPRVTLAPLTVPDEDWAERSQASITPVRVGRVVVAPPWSAIDASSPNDIVIVIAPSMGFGTGHHASTRLCLGLLQRHVPLGGHVLDIGTGSGVLALAAWRLGAARATGVDFDSDALTSAAENVERNHALAHVTLQCLDMSNGATAFAGLFQLTLANLTGALLCRLADDLIATLAPDGHLIVSGVQTDERRTVVDCMDRAGAVLVDEATEDGWVAAAFRTTPTSSTTR